MTVEILDPAADEVLRLRTSDGVRLDAWRWRPPGSPRASVVLVHGFVGRGCSPVLVDHAETLAAAGFDVLVYDARGHGDSEGNCTLGLLERHDVEAAVDAATDRTDDIIVVGESMGAIAALAFAAQRRRTSGVVTVGAPAFWRLAPNLRNIGAALLTRTPLGRRLAEQRLHVRIEPQWMLPDPPAHLAARLDVPYAVIHGADDRFIPERNARELHAHAGGPRRLDIVDGMGHGFGDASVAAVRDAVDWVLTAR